jgi:hypothetical protein
VRADTQADMLRYAHALDRVLQWNYYWIPNYYPPGTSTVWWNRFGMPRCKPAMTKAWKPGGKSAHAADQRTDDRRTPADPEATDVAYILRRLLLIIPTLVIILLVNFVIVQAAPGGPVEQAIAHLQGIGGGAIGGASEASGGPAPAVAWTRN